MLAATVPGDRFDRTFAERIAEVLAYKAIKGDIRAARELADRAEGKPRQALELTPSDGDDFFIGHETPEDYNYFRFFGTDEKPWPTEEEKAYYREKKRWPQQDSTAGQ